MENTKPVFHFVLNIVCYVYEYTHLLFPDFLLCVGEYRFHILYINRFLHGVCLMDIVFLEPFPRKAKAFKCKYLDPLVFE